MKLYHCADARSLRVLWAIEEMGLECELETLPFPPRVRDKAYLEINPLGTIPLLIDGDARITESVAALEYLGRCHGPTPLVIDPDEKAYGDYLNALVQGEATFTFPQTLILRYGMFEPEERRSPQVANDYAEWTLARLRPFAERMTRQQFATGDRFTMADISIGYALFLGKVTGIARQFPESLTAYLERLMERPAFIRARERQGPGLAG